MENNETYSDIYFEVPQLFLPPEDGKPLVIPFGLPCSGKTILTLRLIRYLARDFKCTIYPYSINRSNWPGSYESRCAIWNNAVYSPYAPGGNGIYPYIFTVYSQRNGETVCHIVDLPGEACMFETVPNNYLSPILTSNRRKIWLLIFDECCLLEQNRLQYIQSLLSLHNYISPIDKVLIVFNKIDLLGYFADHKTYDIIAKVNMHIDHICNLYTQVFNKYENKYWIKRLLFGKYNFDYSLFSAGFFFESADGMRRWINGSDFYCEELWGKIKSFFRD